MKKLFLTVLMCSFLLSSCVSTKYVSYSVPQDKIIAFAAVKETTGDIPKDSLVMFGEKLNYVIIPEQSPYLLKILNVKLSKQYSVVTSRNYGILIHPDNTFSERLCLNYDAENKDEETQLEKLNFEKLKFKNRYHTCVQVNGKVYTANPQQILPVDYRFKTPVEVKLAVSKRQFDKEGTVGLLAAPVVAPLFVAGVIVAIPAFVGVATVLEATGQHLE